MAWNPEKKRYECDRCGSPILYPFTLCRECDRWLDEQYGKHKGDGNMRADYGKKEQGEETG